jgi:predicted nucleic acid-binding protein
MKVNNQAIYLDSEYLVYLTITQKPELKKRARILLAKFLAQKIILALSTLTFDEAWEGIRKEVSRLSPKGLPHFHPKVYQLLENITERILSHPAFRIIQFQNPKQGTIKALKNIKDFHLGPRDAFHLAIMKDNGITRMVTNDQKFIEQQERMGVEVKSILL